MNTRYVNKSITKELLLALIPYTKQNILLSFRPNQFFNELEETTRYPKPNLRSAYYRAIKEKLIINEGNDLKISLKGRQIIQPFIAEKLSNNAKLMVIFDIPEEYAGRRQRLRNLLKQLGFKQIQLSVWMSDKDHCSLLFESIVELELPQWVQLYEASKISK